jgi:TolB protein
MNFMVRWGVAASFLAAVATPAAAQIRVDITGGISAPMPIAIPAMPTPAQTNTAAGDTAGLGWPKW